MKYCTENGYKKNDEATEYAAKNGHLECLKYCTKNGYKKYFFTQEEKSKYVRGDKNRDECYDYCLMIEKKNGCNIF